MKGEIKIYRKPEEIDAFYRKFIQRISFQVVLHEAFSMQKRYLDYKFLERNKKIFETYGFSAS